MKKLALILTLSLVLGMTFTASAQVDETKKAVKTASSKTNSGVRKGWSKSKRFTKKVYSKSKRGTKKGVRVVKNAIK